MVFTVVIGDFFASLDISLGHDKHPPTPVERLAIGTAGVIGIAGGIVTWTAIDVPLGIHVEHIAVVALIADGGRDAFTDIFDDGRPLLDRGEREEPEPGTTALHDDV